LSETSGGTELQLVHSGFEGVHGYFASKNFSGVWKKMIKLNLPEAMEKFRYKKVKG